MNRLNSLALLCLCALPLVDGCALATASASRPTHLWPTPGTNWESETFRYAARLRNMSSNEQTAEAEALQKAYAAHRTEDCRLRLALFHALAPQGDRARALSLLDVAPGEANGRGRNHPVAQLLLPLLQDNRRLDDALTTSQNKLRDEQKRADSLQQSNDQTRQKLDALRDIEMKMLERTNSK